MKLTNLIDNVNKQIWNWLNGLLIGTMVGGIVAAFVVSAGIMDEFDIGLAQDKKKKK